MRRPQYIGVGSISGCWIYRNAWLQMIIPLPSRYGQNLAELTILVAACRLPLPELAGPGAAACTCPDL